MWLYQIIAQESMLHNIYYIIVSLKLWNDIKHKKWKSNKNKSIEEKGQIPDQSSQGTSLSLVCDTVV